MQTYLLNDNKVKLLKTETKTELKWLRKYDIETVTEMITNTV